MADMETALAADILAYFVELRKRIVAAMKESDAVG
jgi:hypothetical protein